MLSFSEFQKRFLNDPQFAADNNRQSPDAASNNPREDLPLLEKIWSIQDLDEIADDELESLIDEAGGVESFMQLWRERYPDAPCESDASGNVTTEDVDAEIVNDTLTRRMFGGSTSRSTVETAETFLNPGRIDVDSYLRGLADRFFDLMTKNLETRIKEATEHALTVDKSRSLLSALRLAEPILSQFPQQKRHSYVFQEFLNVEPVHSTRLTGMNLTDLRASVAEIHAAINQQLQNMSSGSD